MVKVLPLEDSKKEDNKKSCFSCVAPSEVTFDCGKNVSKENLTATVRAPDGKVSNCDVRILGNNKIGISLKPKVVGDYKFNVKENGHELPHSPFYVKVNQSDLPDPSNIKLFGDGLHKAYVGIDNEFFIDTIKAGYGSVVVSIDGPADAPMSCVRTKDSLLRILYKPPIQGNYQINVNFDDKVVPECPYDVACIELTNTTTKQKKSEPSKVVDAFKKAELHMYIPNLDNSKLQATVIDPNNHKSASTVDNLGKGYYSVQLKPIHFGKYTIHITNNGEEIQGSPFTFEAGQRQPSNADRVKVSGPGLSYGQAGIPQSFMVDTSEAGPGLVNVIIDGPEPVRAKLKDLKDGRVAVEYTTYTPGHYFITVLFNGIAINDAPYCSYMAPNKSLSTPKKKQQTFNKTPSVTSSPKEQQKMIFFPENEKKLENNSISSLQQQKQTKKISTARLMGPGIENGITGSTNEFEILPLRLIESNYSIEIFGPSKVDLTTENTKDGVLVKYTPYAPGDYTITVKNDGINIDDSPKKIKVNGKKFGGKGINESTVIYTRFISNKTTTVTRYGNGNHNENESLIRVKKVESSAKDIYFDGFGTSNFTPGKAAMFRIFNVGMSSSTLMNNNNNL